MLWSPMYATLRKAEDLLAYLICVTALVLQDGYHPGYDTQRGICAAVSG